MAEASLCFRCLACTSSPQLFLTFPELREHFPAAHSTSLQTEAVLLPSSLEALHCLLCNSSPFLKQEYLREHLRSHNLSTSQVNMVFAKGRKVCRICEQDVKESIEEHLLLNHSQDTFADEEDNIIDEKNLVEEGKAVIKQEDSDEGKVTVEVRREQKQVDQVQFSAPPAKEKECDPEVLARREKQISYGKNTVDYDAYIKMVPKSHRGRRMPRTPDKSKKYSRRQWDGIVTSWKQQIHDVASKEVVESQYQTRETHSTVEKKARKLSVSISYPSVEQIFQESDAKLLVKTIPNSEKLSRPSVKSSIGKSRKPGPVRLSVDDVTNIPPAHEEKTSLFKFCLSKPSKVNVVNSLKQVKSASKVMDKNMNENHIEVLNTVDLESSYETNHIEENKGNKRSFTIKDVISNSSTREKYRKVVDSKCEEFVKTQKLQKPFNNSKAVLSEYGPSQLLPLGDQKLKIFKQTSRPRPNPNYTKEQQLAFSLTPGQVQHDSTYQYVRRLFTSRGAVLTMFLQNNLNITRFGSVVYQNKDVAQRVLQDGFFTFFVDGGFMIPHVFGPVEITVTLFPML